MSVSQSSRTLRSNDRIQLEQIEDWIVVNFEYFNEKISNFTHLTNHLFKDHLVKTTPTAGSHANPKYETLAQHLVIPVYFLLNFHVCIGVYIVLLSL